MSILEWVEQVENPEWEKRALIHVIIVYKMNKSPCWLEDSRVCFAQLGFVPCISGFDSLVQVKYERLSRAKWCFVLKQQLKEVILTQPTLQKGGNSKQTNSTTEISLTWYEVASYYTFIYYH